MRTATYLRNFIFGVEDSLVSTVGLLSGVAIAGVDSKTILLTGVILIFVEAISMAAGSFLSEVSADEYAHANDASTQSAFAAVVMFCSYFVAGFIPLLPYALLSRESAFAYSIGASVIAMFVLGAWSGSLSKRGIWRGAIRMAVVGGVAIGVGTTVGLLLG